MLQALLALALVIGFLPVFVRKIDDGNENRVNAAAAQQITGAWEAARAFLFEEADNLPIGIKTFAGDAFVDALEPFGLPLGFIPRTPLGQDISLVIAKDKNGAMAFLRAGGGAKLPVMRRAAILSRIGFWGAVVEDGRVIGETGGWELESLPRGLVPNQDDIYVRVPEDEEFSELVARKSKNPAKNVFHTDLKMDGNNMTAGKITAGSAEIKVVAAGDFRLSGIEADRKNKNEIGLVRAGKVWFSDAAGNPLKITRSDLRAARFQSNGIGNYGDMPSLTAGRVVVRDFNMTAGRTSFAGPAKWDIKSGATMTNITISVEKLDITAHIDASRGQDVFLNDTGTDLEYSAGSGIKADVIKTDNIVLRDLTSTELLGGGGAGAGALLEIRPAGTSVLPDALVSGISNDSLKIPLNAADNDGKLESCKSIIERLGGRYDNLSLADNIVCRFVMLNRIEHRIEIKKCLDAGGDRCE